MRHRESSDSRTRRSLAYKIQVVIPINQLNADPILAGKGAGALAQSTPAVFELEGLALLLSFKLWSLLEAAKQPIREGKGINHEDFWREVESAETSRISPK
ncbi:MAG: hypothetical protein M1281_05460 [Chloroflexi bacterium]|nr:hypothetical protein [Chloroflexota bacterium]